MHMRATKCYFNGILYSPNKLDLKPGTKLVVWLIQKSSIVTYVNGNFFFKEVHEIINEGG